MNGCAGRGGPDARVAFEEAFCREVGAGRGFRRRDVPLVRVESALRAHDEALRTASDAVLKLGRKTRVTRHEGLVVKETVPLGTLGRLRDFLWPRRHRAGLLAAWRLEQAGIDTARGVAWLRRSGRVFSVMEDLSGLVRLDHLARSLYAGPPSDPPGRGALRDASARWLSALHRRGVYHGDMKGVNVLVARDPSGFRFHLIDTDRVLFFRRPVGRRRRRKNLAQLAASIPRSVTRTERLRWMLVYEDGAPWRRGLAADARDVAARLRKKRVVVDEPIE